MLDREACERRVYRLALLLTGRRESAAAVIEQVVGAQPDLSRLDSAHMDRLTVLRSREQPDGPLQFPGIQSAAAAALCALPEQQREAWVFTVLYQLDDRTAAKAMDCSFRAVQRHREQADAALSESLGGEAAALAEQVRRAMLSVDVPEFFREAQRRRRRMRRALVVAVIVLSVLAALAAVSWLAQHLT